MTDRVPKKHVWRGALVLFFLAVSLTHVILGRGERSAWVSMTQPGDRFHQTNSLLGYCFLHGDEPFMKENLPHVMQVGLFSGSRDVLALNEFREDFRFLRPLYSYLAALMTPPLAVLAAMLVLNWRSWAVCVWTAWRITRTAFHSETAAAVAGALATGGIGMTAHVADYSPHLLAFATYYFGAWLLYDSGVWRPRTNCGSAATDGDAWRTHLRIGLYLAVANLAYSSGVMLAGVYVVTAFHPRRLFPIFAAVAIALGPRLALRAALGSRVDDVEAEYLSRGLAAWQDLLHGGRDHAMQPLHWLSEYLLFFDSPLVVLLGLACLFLAPMSRSKRWPFLCLVGVPLAVSLPFAPVATARGYLVYPATIAVYACLGRQIARCGRRRRGVLRAAAMVIVGIVLITHLLWSGAHLARNLGPVKTYFLGWDDGWRFFRAKRTLSLTGAEPTPVLFGGRASLSEAGAFAASRAHRLHPDQVSFGFTLLTGAPFFAVVGAWAMVAVPAGRPRIAAAVAWAAIFGLHVAASHVWFRELPAFFPVDRALILVPGERLTLQVAVSPEFARALRDRVDQGDHLLVRGPTVNAEGLDLLLLANDEPLDLAPTSNGLLAVKAPLQLAQRLAAADTRRLTLEVVNRRQTVAELAGWQRAGLPLRDCTVQAHDGAERQPQVLPVLELRAFDTRERLILAGF
jgi:hypothetical protein